MAEIVQIDVDQLTATLKAQNEANLEKIGVNVDERISKMLDERLQDFAAEMKAATKKPDVDPNTDPRGGFKSFDHLCYELYQAGPGAGNKSETLKGYMDRTKAAGSPSQTAGDAELGGVLIPTEFASMILERQAARSSIMQSAMIIPMTSNKIEIPYINNFNESQGRTSGNVEFYWAAEKAARTATNVEFGNVELNLRKLTGMAYMTEELMRFSPGSSTALLNRAFDLGMNRALTKSFINGTGAGQPLGFRNAPCTISIAKELAQAKDTLTTENIVKMFARFYSESENGGGGMWLTNKTTIPQLLTLTLSVGTGGSVVYLSNIKDAQGWQILGDPVTFSDQMATLGDVGDIAVADWSQYLIGQDAGGPEMASSIHLKFDYDQTAFKFTFYTDGAPWWKEPFSPENGDTQSPFVTLAERA